MTTTRIPAAQSRPALRFPLWLPALTLASFAIGTADMVVAGILPDVAADLAVSQPAAGQLVTVFSLTYGLGAPVLAVLLARVDHRRLLLASTWLFALACALTALAPGFASVLALRAATAVCAAVLGPAALATAAALAPAGRQGRYLGAVTAGLTVSLVAGVPVGTWIGGAWGWRATMLAVALMGLIAAVGMLVLPRATRPAELSLSERLRPLRRPVVLAVTLGLVVAGSGGMMPYIYLAPLFGELTGGGTQSLGVAVMAFGVAGFLGVLLGGRGADIWGAGRTLVFSFALPVAMMAVLGAAGAVLAPGALPFAVFVAVTVVWALGIWAMSPPLQAWLLRRADGADSAILALNTSGLYLGFAVAGSLGGGMLGAWGPGALLPTSASLLLLGGVLGLGSAFWWLAPREDRRGSERY